MSAAESDTDPYQLESCCIQEETSSGSLLPYEILTTHTGPWLSSSDHYSGLHPAPALRPDSEVDGVRP